MESAGNESYSIGEIAIPDRASFLDYDKERTLEKAVRRLEAKGINNILIVHLSPTSYSNHHEEIRYLVGLRKDLGVYTEMTEKPIKSTSRFAVSLGMDRTPSDCCSTHRIYS